MAPPHSSCRWQDNNQTMVLATSCTVRWPKYRIHINVLSSVLYCAGRALAPTLQYPWSLPVESVRNGISLKVWHEFTPRRGRRKSSIRHDHHEVKHSKRHSTLAQGKHWA